jgi:hypothetical protein
MNRWVAHVKEFSKRTGKTYGCAISDPECKASYVKAPKAPRKARTPKQPKEPKAPRAPRKARTPKQSKSIRERLQERIEKNRMNSTPLTEKQLMMKQDMESRIPSFKRGERISGIPAPPQNYSSKNLTSSTNIPKLKK